MNFLLALAYIFTLSILSLVALYGKDLPPNENLHSYLFAMVFINIFCVSEFAADAFNKNKK